MQIKLAEALLRRKELATKVEQLQRIKIADVYETRVKRAKVTDSIDDVVADVAKLTASQVTKEYDWYASQLRKLDAAIQQANWLTEIEVDSGALTNYDE